MNAQPTDSAELQRRFSEFARTRDRALRDELVSAHLSLAEYLARRFANRGEPLDDLVQVASLGLVKAVDRFDPDRGVAFSTFATQTIVGELKRHFRDRGWAIRAPRRLQELYLRLGEVVANLSQQLGRSPTIAEMAAQIDVSEEEVLEAMEAGQAYRFASLDAPAPRVGGRGAGRGGGGERQPDGGQGGDGETLATRIGEPDTELEKVEDRATLSPLLARLPERDRVIVDLRFFQGLTQSEIAARLGVSQMHVSRLLARCLAELRTGVGEG